MTITIPSDLQWVAFLVGAEWPQGDEDAMFGLGDRWHGAATRMHNLIPDLNNVRQETMSCLSGETATAADHQFSMLFDGDYSVDKLAQAMTAIGDLAQGCGTQIEYSKLQALSALAMAATEILWAYASAAETWGASLAEVPIIELFTNYSIREIIGQCINRIFAGLESALSKTLVKELIKKGIYKDLWMVPQELAIEETQVLEGHRKDINWDQVAKVSELQFVNGVANKAGKTGVENLAGKVFGKAETQFQSTVLGTVAGYAGGMAGTVAPMAITGNLDELTPTKLFGSAIKSGIKGGVSSYMKGGSSATAEETDPQVTPPPD
ncbi:WXG100 family type VII secretion target [Mycolicibacterium sp. CBMA 226]|uniref:WXG100 family type VII secretion target n=1 Tax=Mycolicibacterium sp. CBMA 226 TaxID=2606611 RepID=UPI0012DD5882|nr:hypothetical protein [Mycolicibacterium sp. CBMA 226]MUL78868.1 hypothetical protein [Mycolicibacterium sp. CBMA 226]QGW61167.1 hypothetical protein ICEMyc226_00135 [Mycolicibacterium sp.]